MGRQKKQTAEKKFGVIDEKKVVSTSEDIETTSTINDYMDILYYQTKQRNGLLGGFARDGKYTVRNKDILDHLLNVPKKFEEKVDSVVYVSAKKGVFVLNFKIEFDICPDYCTAKLFLIEVEHAIEEDVKHVTELDELILPYSPTFSTEVYKQWKVWKESQVYQKDDFLFELLEMMREEYLFNKELIDLLSQHYMLRMLEYLGKCGELGEKTRADYQRIVDSILKKDPSITQDFSRLKLILDKVIKENGLYNEIGKTEEGRKLLNGYSQPLKKFKETATVLEVVKQDKQIKQEKVQESAKKVAVENKVENRVEKAKESVSPTIKNSTGYTLSPVKGGALLTFADVIKEITSILPYKMVGEVIKTLGQTFEDKTLEQAGSKLSSGFEDVLGLNELKNSDLPKYADPKGKSKDSKSNNDKTVVTILSEGASPVTIEMDNSTSPNLEKTESFNPFKDIGGGYGRSKDIGNVKNAERIDLAGGVIDGKVSLERENPSKSMDDAFKMR